MKPEIAKTMEKAKRSHDIEQRINKVLEDMFAEQLSPVIGRVLQMSLLEVGLKIVERDDD